MHSTEFQSLARRCDEFGTTVYAVAELPSGTSRKFAVVTYNPDLPNGSAFSFYPEVLMPDNMNDPVVPDNWAFGASTYSMTRQRAMLEFAACLVRTKNWMERP